MKAPKPLKRSGLKRPTREQVTAWEQKPRTPLRRTRLKQGKGTKAVREQPDIASFRERLQERSGGECEAQGVLYWMTIAGGEMSPSDQLLLVCGTHDRHHGAHPHHVWPEDRDAGIHDPERGLWLCARSHAWAHDHPALAAEFGLLRPTRVPRDLRPDRSPRPTL